MSFSALDRPQHLHGLSNTAWDLLIIGGGITGAGILLDAVSRGFKVALIEKGDFASGTSSKSTKLIHGGLRYLKNLEIGLVREVGRERAIVHANARHLVRPEPMLLPIYHDGSIGRISGSIGLWFYDLLADVERKERRRMLSREETLEIEPLLRAEGLLGSGLYYEYRTDDARLTVSLIRTAVESGALALNYVSATGFIYQGDTVCGVTCRDMLGQSDVEIRATKVINATGPWLDDILALQVPAPPVGKKLLLSKGVHIVIPQEKLPIRQAMYFDTPSDGRMVFCIPRDQAVYVGTTDSVYGGVLEDIDIQLSEVDYLLSAVNHLCPGRVLYRTDVISAWAGVRPLIYEQGKSPSELSRKDEIFTSPNGLVSIAGGKLTGYRKMADRIMDAVVRSAEFADRNIRDCHTEEIAVSGSGFGSEQDLEGQLETLCTSFPDMSPVVIRKLFFRYGTDTMQILEAGRGSKQGLMTAEVRHAIRNEMALHISDFVFRRTSDIYFDQLWLLEHLDVILRTFTEEFGWDATQAAAEIEPVQTFLQKYPMDQV